MLCQLLRYQLWGGVAGNEQVPANNSRGARTILSRVTVRQQCNEKNTFVSCCKVSDEQKRGLADDPDDEAVKLLMTDA